VHRLRRAPPHALITNRKAILTLPLPLQAVASDYCERLAQSSGARRPTLLQRAGPGPADAWLDALVGEDIAMRPRGTPASGYGGGKGGGYGGGDGRDGEDSSRASSSPRSDFGRRQSCLEREEADPMPWASR